MKITKLFFAVALCLFSVNAVLAQEHDHSKMANPKSETSEKIMYKCPMHADVNSNKPGNCSECGMKLVKNDNSSAKKYTCSMHPEFTSNNEGECPKCGMVLVEKKEKNMGDMKSKDGHDHNHEH
jgi:hypothetical protein